mmetsp:Transcript_81429/g.131989  ORF Transcript_81429/g.131989 Transcript_81429/m.131989 type:complete len:222 (+) Transcript_81429:487-1152(+)
MAKDTMVLLRFVALVSTFLHLLTSVALPASPPCRRRLISAATLLRRAATTLALSEVPPKKLTWKLVQERTSERRVAEEGSPPLPPICPLMPKNWACSRRGVSAPPASPRSSPRSLATARRSSTPAMAMNLSRNWDPRLVNTVTATTAEMAWEMIWVAHAPRTSATSPFLPRKSGSPSVFRSNDSSTLYTYSQVSKARTNWLGLAATDCTVSVMASTGSISM